MPAGNINAFSKMVSRTRFTKGGDQYDREIVVQNLAPDPCPAGFGLGCRCGTNHSLGLGGGLKVADGNLPSGRYTALHTGSPESCMIATQQLTRATDLSLAKVRESIHDGSLDMTFLL